jgi:hypothetical protein
MFTSFALNFIKNNKRKPFFLYYAMPLCHKPLTPTPDDPLLLPGILQMAVTLSFLKW